MFRHIARGRRSWWIPATLAGLTLITACSDEPTPLAPSFTMPPIRASVTATSTLYLHGSGGTQNPPTLFLDGSAPTATTASFKDSPGVHLSGGNPWATVGTWPAAAALVEGSLTGLGNVALWVGLKNSDDAGTRFDVRVEVRKNGAAVASGELRCITGVVRNPNQARAISVAFDPFAPQDFDGTGDVLTLTVMARIGTTATGSPCGGHGSAVGLRTYFDATHRAASFAVTTETDDCSAGGPGCWSSAHTAVPYPQGFHHAAELNGILYIVGGYNRFTGPVNAFYAYDSGAETWTSKAPLPVHRLGAGTAALGGLVYVIGGFISGQPSLMSVDAYDPATDTWSSRAPLPVASTVVYAGVIGANIFALLEDGDGSPDLVMYDPGTDSWTYRAAPPGPLRNSPAVAVLGGKLYLAGGLDNFTQSPAALFDILIAYDPVTDTWTQRAPMPTARYSAIAGVVGGLLYVVGGADLNSFLATAERYNPVTDQWETIAPLSGPRVSVAVAGVNGLLFAIGGDDGSQSLTIVESFQP